MRVDEIDVTGRVGRSSGSKNGVVSTNELVKSKLGYRSGGHVDRGARIGSDPRSAVDRNANR
jgi:hypothetical protein